LTRPVAVGVLRCCLSYTVTPDVEFAGTCLPFPESLLAADRGEKSRRSVSRKVKHVKKGESLVDISSELIVENPQE